MEKNNKLNELIAESLHNIEALSNTDCVIGKPIFTASGCQVIPFSKITLGNLSGGGEYGDVKTVKELRDIPFAAGLSVVIGMKPLGFLVDDGKSCKIIKVTDDALDNMVEQAGTIMRDILSKTT